MNVEPKGFQEQGLRTLKPLREDVAWIKRKREGRAASEAKNRANLAIGISIAVGIGSRVGVIVSLFR